MGAYVSNPVTHVNTTVTRNFVILRRERRSDRHGRACPGHPRLEQRTIKDVDARHKAGHDVASLPGQIGYGRRKNWWSAFRDDGANLMVRSR
jgi:hypothetical protein